MRPHNFAADLEATTQHAPINVTAAAEQHTLHAPLPVNSPERESEQDADALWDPQDERNPDNRDEDGVGQDAGKAGDESDNEQDADEVAEIDATLARFSAVHDQIAKEEEQRRTKFAWLFGKRKEPELGTDMPFDFVEGRDSQASRLEWKKQQRKRRTVLIAKAVAIAAVATILVATGIGWSAKTWINSKFREVSSLDPNSSSIKDIGKQSGDRNFLLVGSDTRVGSSADDGVGSVEDEPGARADTTMIAHIPADRSRVLVVSFPRDLEVDLPACERWDPRTGEYTGEQTDPQENVKLNQAYAVGGPKCTTKLVQQISGLSVTNFLGIDFQGFKSMVNSVNGVNICTEKPIIDGKLGVLLPEAGPQTIDGTQALNYVRARDVEGDITADYGRMQRQQLFLSALLRKAMSGDVLLDPNKLGDFVNSVAANTFGENVSTDQLLDLGQSMQGLDANKVTFITVPTTGEANDRGNEELLETRSAELFRGIIEGAPLTEQQKPDTPRAASTQPSAAGTGGPALARPAPPADEPKDVPIRVFNTTDRAGLAAQTQGKLEEVGFTVAGTGQADTPTKQTVIKHTAENAGAAQALAKSITGAKTVEDPSAGGELRLELGSDFNGKVFQGKAEIPDNLDTVNAGQDVCG